MRRKLIITVDEEIYQGLQQQVGRGNISSFIEDLIRQRLLTRRYLEEGYKAMAADTEHEAEAYEWVEGLIDESVLGMHPAIMHAPYPKSDARLGAIAGERSHYSDARGDTA